MVGLSHRRWGEHAQIEAAGVNYPLHTAECGFTIGHTTYKCDLFLQSLGHTLTPACSDCTRSALTSEATLPPKRTSLESSIDLTALS